jgi:hypothetical protein
MGVLFSCSLEQICGVTALSFMAARFGRPAGSTLTASPALGSKLT